jgi:hypothetical protein
MTTDAVSVVIVVLFTLVAVAVAEHRTTGIEEPRSAETN